MKNIRFANLKFDYDQQRVADEIGSLKDLHDLPAKEAALNEQWRIPLFTDEQVNNTTYWSDELSTTIVKKYPAWQGIGLTKLGNNRHSLGGAVRIRNHNANGNWTWRDDLSVSYIRETVERLGFKEIHTVRVLMLPAGGIGLIHNDDVNNTYVNNNGFSVTLNIDNGGSPLVYVEDGVRYDLYPDKAFIFSDNCWHGVPQVSRKRIQLRISGIADFDHLGRMIDEASIKLVAGHSVQS
jgi:hypothetical protein